MDSSLSISDDDRPLYQQVRDHIKARLTSGVWKPGDLLPTELELSREFEISPGTVRQAILSLVREGLLTRRAGRGTFVARIESWHSFDRFFRFREGHSGKDFRPEIHLIKTKIVKARDAEVARKLNLKQGDEALSLQRLLVQNGTPVCVYHSFLPGELAPGLQGEDLTERLYPILERKFGIYVVRAEEFLRAVEADSDIAQRLDVKKGAPVILIERIVYTFDEKIIEFRRTYGRSDRFSYKIQLR